MNVCEDGFGDQVQVDYVPFHTRQINLQNETKKKERQ